MSFISDFISLIYPRLCQSCKKALLKDDDIICLECQYGLPQTNFHFDIDNAITKLFWGKVVIENAAAYYYFTKKSKVQRLIYNFKYRGNQNIGMFVGKLYGKELILSPFYQNIDYIIPVPLYHLKEKKRGFNQSVVFAKGIAQAMNKPIDINTLHRIKPSESQTTKHRYERYENVKEIFIVKDTSHLIGKHILLIDDVITTGATIEACAKSLHQIKNIRISVAALAFAGI
jgi:ComF family protein